MTLTGPSANPLATIAVGALWTVFGVVFVWAVWPRGHSVDQLLAAAEEDAAADRAAAAATSDLEDLGQLWAAYCDEVDQVVDAITDDEVDDHLRRLLPPVDADPAHLDGGGGR